MTHIAARLSIFAGLSGLAFVVGWPAAAQVVEPWRSPAPPSAGRAQVTSGVDATAPTAGEQRQARALATAIFAKPAAAARAADKAAPPTPGLAAVQPKPEWSQKDGPQVGGDGLTVSRPF